MISVNCKKCSKEFKTYPYNIKVGWGKYCSKKCYYDRSARAKSKECTKCGETYLRSQSLDGKRWDKSVVCGLSCHLKGNKHSLGYKHTEETKKKWREFAIRNNTAAKNLVPKYGPEHPNWIADRTKLKVSDFHAYDARYKDWMLSTKRRDGWRCKISNSDCTGRLEAHHILSWIEYPELRYELNNGITLCVAHHPRKRAEVTRLAPVFQEIISR